MYEKKSKQANYAPSKCLFCSLMRNSLSASLHRAFARSLPRGSGLSMEEGRRLLPSQGFPDGRHRRQLSQLRIMSRLFHI